MFLKSSNIKKYKEIYKKLLKEEHKLSNDYYDALDNNFNTEKIDKLKAEKQNISERIDSLIENDYAKAVYDIYNSKKPKLILLKNDSEITWDDAFGCSFEEMSKPQKHALVGLIENTGMYRFK